MPINLNGTTFNNGGVAKFINTALDSIKHGTTEVWKKMTYFFNGGTVSGYSWIDGFTTYPHMGVGSTIWSDSQNQVSGVAEGFKRCAFDASLFSTIYVNVTTCYCPKIASSDNTAGYVFIGNASQSVQNVFAGASYTRGGKISGAGLITLDVSALSGTYYVVIGGAKSTGQSYNIVVDQVYGV